ncbi:MAG: sigma-70 family RNA polymerase sigma factor [Lachnospiraceae bacterium]|nr:sigma-70 family RNA polymerase sigma factor [Lachnospiraceae bacterium]
MDDVQLINLYFERSEAAITETENKYGKYCRTVVGNVLQNAEDAEEVMNDTYLAAWNAIPPAKPNCFKAFIGKIARNLALDRFKRENAQKRGGGEIVGLADELADVLPDKETTESAFEAKELTRHINEFLAAQPKDKRRIFVLRYWYMKSMDEIAESEGLGISNVKVSLMRLRQALKEHLKTEGYEV